MAYNFLRGDRDQPFLLPPDLRDWLPDGHLAWFVLDVVDQLDLTAFYRAHRNDGHGHPAYDPRLLLGVLLYGYCIGCARLGGSSGAASRTFPSGSWPEPVPRRCDHRQVPRAPRGGAGRLPGPVLAAVRRGRDGSGRCGGAGRHQGGRQRRRPSQPHPGQAPRGGHRDPAGGGRDRPGRGSRWPGPWCRAAPELVSPAGRLARLRQAKAQLEADAAERQRRYQQPRARIKPRPRDEAPDPKATANTTDPDSRFVRGGGRTLQGYNAQAVATADQVVVAAALTQQANDVQQLAPMLMATTATFAGAGITERPIDALGGRCSSTAWPGSAG
jgi:hypothetical protein